MTAAEQLLTIEKEFSLGKEKLVIAVLLPGQTVEGNCGRLAVALKLRQNPSLALRAMVEGWSLDRICRELH